MSWCTIESDPGVFTELIQDIGVKGVQVEELYSLDSESFLQLKPVYGLVFLFKWDPTLGASSSSSSASPASDSMVDPDLFFAKQVISNACATQAILSILLNSPDIDVGDTLREFQSFTAAFPPDLKGLAISNCEKIRTSHNSFTHPEPFVTEHVKASSKEEDVYHFVAYLPFRGKVYELDGLKDAPVYLGNVPTMAEGDWIDVVRPVLMDRFEKYAASEIRFNLLALIRNRQEMYQAQINSLLTTMTTGRSESQEADIEHLQAMIQSERAKFESWRTENIRRKHNYLPFIVQLLKILARKGQLQPLIQQQQQPPPQPQPQPPLRK